jgi:hypothetical protein
MIGLNVAEYFMENSQIYPKNMTFEIACWQFALSAVKSL